MHVRCEGLKLSIFRTTSEWLTEHGICDEPRVRTRFQCHNSVVLCYTIIRRAIGEQWDYVVKISFRFVAHYKFMLCRPPLGGFMTYPFL
jgi:hypothetical protein